MKVEFFKHSVDATDKKNVLAVLDSLFLSMGETVKTFERNFSKYLSAQETIAVNSCTSALHLCLIALGIKPGDEVITTPLSFIATANVIEYVGATPVFVDVNPDTGNIDEDKIEAAITKKTKAILPVHLYGQMCDMKKIARLAKKYKLKVIEDAAHATESKRDGYRPGNLSDAACFSFYATKNITCGEGGAIVTQNKKLAEKLRILRLHGMSKSAADRYTKLYQHYDMPLLGWKYNMNNIQAALLLHQLEKIEERLKLRANLVDRYNAALSKVPEIRLIAKIPKAKSAYHLYTIQVAPQKRDSTIHALQGAGVGVAVNFRPIHLMQYYRKKYGYKRGTFPHAEKIGASTITLPLYPLLTRAEQEYVISLLLTSPHPSL